MGRKKGVKSPYWLPANKRWEIKHVCLCYNDWKKRIAWKGDSMAEDERRFLNRAIALVEEAARQSGPGIEKHLLFAITSGVPYVKLDGIPCGVDYFYERRKKCFYLLDKALTHEERETLMRYKS